MFFDFKKMLEADNEVKWYYRPWVIILLMVLFVGPFGLPLLYKSPRFSKFWKVIITFFIIGFTIYMTYVTIHTCKTLLQSYGPLL